MIGTLTRLGSMWFEPRVVLRAHAAGQTRGPLEAVLIYVVVQLCIAGRLLYRHLSLASEAPDVVRRRITETLWSLSGTDVSLFFCVLVALLLLGRVLRRVRTSSRGLAAAAGYLLLPLALLKAIGITTLWLGIDQWWLPHHPIDSHVVFLKGELVVGRFVTKLLVSYGLPALLLLALVKETEVGWLSPALGAVSVALLSSLCFGSVADVMVQRATLRPTLPGDVMPSLRLPWLSPPKSAGRFFELNELSGKVVILDFWASWCVPCRRSMPELQRLQDELGPQGLAVIGINREPYDQAAATEALRELGLSFPSALDNRGYGERLGLTSLPSTYVVDRQGILRHLHLGYVDAATVRQEAEVLLREMALPVSP
ncbi:MAG: TlpA disulfide reductase family protein [Myxococcota bacterium]